MTSLGEIMLYKTPPPYFIVLVSSVKTKKVKVIEFHRIANQSLYAAVQNQKVVSAYLWSEQILPFGFARSIESRP